ncbi:MAG: PAS domain-containing protein, partial [Planctomycetota bacterium]
MFMDVSQLVKPFRFASAERSRLLSYIQILIALVFLVGVAAMSASAVRSARSSAANDLVTRGGIVTSIVSRAAARALDHADPADANATLEKVIYDIRAEEGLEFAFIVDRGRRALAHSDTSLLGKVLDIALEPAEEAEARQAWADDGFYYVTRPADPSRDHAACGGMVHEFVRPVRLGARAKEKYLGDLELHLGFTLPGWGSFTQSSAKKIVPGLAVAFLLLIIGNYVAGVLIRPLSTLKRETATAAKATDDWQLEVDAKGDIADIARNWNDMVGNFRSSYESMVEARRELEVRNRVMLYEKKRTESVLDSLSDGVLVTDSYGKISFINRECENTLGLSREETIGRSPADVIGDESIAKFIAGALPPVNGAGRGHGAAAAPRSAAAAPRS